MTFRELWAANFVAGNMIDAAYLRGALRRTSWHPDVGVMMDANGLLVLVQRHGDDQQGFGLPWGVTHDDMVAQDWELAP